MLMDAWSQCGGLSQGMMLRVQRVGSLARRCSKNLVVGLCSYFAERSSELSVCMARCRLSLRTSLCSPMRHKFTVRLSPAG